MNNPLVTIVVPVYNVEKYLNRCVESIVNQTYENLEIILVDDGSPDNCPQICDEWAEKDNRIKVVHKVNAGAGMARNTGLDNATGEYIFFFDSDDRISTQTVEKCINNAKEHNSDVVIFGRYDFFENGKQTGKSISTNKTCFKHNEIREELIPAMLTYKYGISTSNCSKMYKADLFKKLNKRFVSERELYSEDVYFTVDLFSDIDTVSILNENLYYYYFRENSLSRAYNPNRQQKQNDIFYKKTMELARKKNLSEKTLDNIAIRYHMYSIGNMKQVVIADIDNKKEIYRSFFHDETLLSTLTDDILCQEERNSQFFWKLFRKKQMLVCYLLLYYKAKF